MREIILGWELEYLSLKVSTSWFTKLKKPVMLKKRAVDLSPLSHASYMSWVKDRPMSRVDECDLPLNWVPGTVLRLAISYWIHLA